MKQKQGGGGVPIALATPYLHSHLMCWLKKGQVQMLFDWLLGYRVMLTFYRFYNNPVSEIFSHNVVNITR